MDEPVNAGIPEEPDDPRDDPNERGHGDPAPPDDEPGPIPEEYEPL